MGRAGHDPVTVLRRELPEKRVHRARRRVADARVHDLVGAPYDRPATRGLVDARAPSRDGGRTPAVRERVRVETSLLLEHRHPDETVAVVELHAAVGLSIHVDEL